jgi:hypothetical protein
LGPSIFLSLCFSHNVRHQVSHPNKTTSKTVLPYILIFIFSGGPGSVVGIATAYGLDGPGIESRWGRDFPDLSSWALRST